MLRPLNGEVDILWEEHVAFHCTSQIFVSFRVEAGDPEGAENIYQGCLRRWWQVLLWCWARGGCCGCDRSGFFGLRPGAFLEVVGTWSQPPGFLSCSQARDIRRSLRNLGWDGEPKLCEIIISPFHQWFPIWVDASFEEAGEVGHLTVFLLEALLDLCHGACVPWFLVELS